MILLDTRKKDFKKKFLRLVDRASGADPKIARSAFEIVEDVRKNGDKALFKWTKKLDRLDLTKKTARVEKSEFKKAGRILGEPLKRTIMTSFINVVEFHANQIETSWVVKTGKSRVGQIIRPLRRAGLYVPGGKASYPSSVIMNAVPAMVAGVEEIAVCSPCAGGDVSPAVLFAADLCGISEFYKVGGAQAISAMAYGTETIAKVDKITGPGNAYVAEAKRLVYGAVGVDMVAGPSEICVVADDTANPAWCAADLLSQAEHDELAIPIFVSPSQKMCAAVAVETARQAKLLERRGIAEKCLKNRFVVIKTKNIAEAIRLANELAPEHLELAVKNASKMLDDVQNAGAVFAGHYSPEALGDYLAGPNHVLPTSGSARFSSPLGVYDFIKRTSVIDYSKKDFLKVADHVAEFANAEGLTAHAKSALIRKGGRR
ncbi:MAG: histidinol dehydrogenase [Nitrospinae bacterium]|nr:histidinol dehydrogenase [Nitrospinota bacterium]